MFRKFLLILALVAVLSSAQYLNYRLDGDLVPAMPHTIRSPAGIRLPVNADYIQAAPPMKRHSLLDNLYGIGYAY